MLYNLFLLIQKFLLKIHVILFNSLIKNKLQAHNGMIIRPHQLKGLGHISIGKNTLIAEGAIITAIEKRNNEKFNPSILIGDNCCLGEHIQISAIKSVIIGNNVLTGRYVYISDNNHGTKNDLHLVPSLRPLSSKGPIVIGDNVWIGEHVCILSGVKIGDNSIIAANAVVTHDVPENAIFGGIPAKSIIN